MNSRHSPVDLFAFLVALATLSLASACGGDTAPVDAAIVDAFIADADPRPDSLSDSVSCNAVWQTACNPEERCTVVRTSVDSLVDGFAACKPDGTRLRDEPCTVEPTTGVDDCVGGTLCYPTSAGVGTCSEICYKLNAVDSCTHGSCVLFGDFQVPVWGICVEDTDAGL